MLSTGQKSRRVSVPKDVAPRGFDYTVGFPLPESVRRHRRRSDATLEGGRRSLPARRASPSPEVTGPVCRVPSDASLRSVIDSLVSLACCGLGYGRRATPAIGSRGDGAALGTCEHPPPRRDSGALREAERTSPEAEIGLRLGLVAACFSGRARPQCGAFRRGPRGTRRTSRRRTKPPGRLSASRAGSRTPSPARGSAPSAREFWHASVPGPAASEEARSASLDATLPFRLSRWRSACTSEPASSSTLVRLLGRVSATTFVICAVERSAPGRRRDPFAAARGVLRRTAATARVGRRARPTGWDRSIFEARGFGGWVVTHSLADADFHGHRPAVVTLSRPSRGLVDPSLRASESARFRPPREGGKRERVPPPRGRRVRATLGCFRLVRADYRRGPTETYGAPDASANRRAAGRLRSLRSGPRPLGSGYRLTCLYVVRPTTRDSRCPGGHFRRNQLPGDSIGLSPLLPLRGSDLHVSTPQSVRPGFPGLPSERE